ncbi:MAG: glycoside hydrolase family 3, partial [Candidatus Cloacimonetes bacterium]|nr:glycoside hydrolase family 3 [Candidatus Cloacimonadota bacterium]
SQIDSLYPATISEKSINGLLRDKLGWQGVVVSDCLYMKAIHTNYSLEETIEKSVNAGVDILLFASPNPDDNIAGDAFNSLKAMVISGRISYERIEESYRRIMTLKQKINH